MAGDTTLDSNLVETKVYDKDGNEVDASKLNEAGVWTVKVKVKAQATEYMYQGEAECVVTVTNGQVATKDVVFTIDGKAVGANAEVDYDGTDVLEKLVVNAKVDGKALTQGTDFQVVAYKDGEKVDKVVEAGTYSIKLTSDKYDFADDEGIELEVKSIKATDLRIAPASLLHGVETTTEIGYTGSAIVPVVQYNTGKLDDDGEAIWKDLPAGTYKLSYDYKKKDADKFAAVKEMKELGSYKVTVKDADKNDSIEVKNGVLQDSKSKAIVFKVVEGKVYADVAPSDWFYEYVYDAQDYIKGIGDSDIFAPGRAPRAPWPRPCCPHGRRGRRRGHWLQQPVHRRRLQRQRSADDPCYPGRPAAPGSSSPRAAEFCVMAALRRRDRRPPRPASSLLPRGRRHLASSSPRRTSPAPSSAS